MTSDLEPIDPELGALIERARARDIDDPSYGPKACERLLARVERRLDGAGATSNVPAATTRLAWHASVAAACTAAAIATAIMASGVAERPAPAPGHEPASAQPERTASPPDEDGTDAVPTMHVDALPTAPALPLAPAGRTTSSAVAPSEADTRARPLPAPGSRPPTSESAPGGDLAAELRLVDAARAAMKGGRHAEGMRRLAEHEALHPNGQLAQQRERLFVEALVATGDLEGARRRAAALRRRHPNSLLSPTIERVLEGDAAHAP